MGDEAKSGPCHAQTNDDDGNSRDVTTFNPDLGRPGVATLHDLPGIASRSGSEGKDNICVQEFALEDRDLELPETSKLLNRVSNL